MVHIAFTVAGDRIGSGARAGWAAIATDSVTPTTLITRADIDETPGASRTLGMQMITDYVPGAYMTHDMLHMRGGHQTSWLIDGVAIPNTKIASNVGPQIDPKDIDSLEVQRGSYSSDVGDRTYGVFNVLPRNGFERNRDAELLSTGGNLYAGEAQLSLRRSLRRNRLVRQPHRLALQLRPGDAHPAIFHDATNSGSGFVSLIRNQTANDQIRITGAVSPGLLPDSLRSRSQRLRDHFRPTTVRLACATARPSATPSPSPTGSTRSRPKAILSVAPFYHFNQSNYDSPANDHPVATTWHQTSNYGGGQADFRDDFKRNNFSAGLYSFYQARERPLRRPSSTTAPLRPSPTPQPTRAPDLVEFYVSDHLHIGRYVTLLGGERFSVFRAALNETAIYPRIGATVEIPRLHWVLRGFYGHFFQPAPLETVSSSVLNYASNLPSGENTFTPLPSERDEEHQFGIADSLQGLDARRLQHQEPRQQLPRSLQPRRIQHVLPHRRRWRAGSRLGDDPALAASGAHWATSTSPIPTRSPSSAAPSLAASPAASRAIRRATRRTSPTAPSITTSATRSTPASPPACRHTPGLQPMCTTARASPTASPAQDKDRTRATTFPFTPLSMSPPATASATI